MSDPKPTHTLYLERTAYRPPTMLRHRQTEYNEGYYDSLEGESIRIEPIRQANAKLIEAIEKLLPPHDWSAVKPGSKQHMVMHALHNLRQVLETEGR